ncbi:MAG: hypothetical protein HY259_10625 [Chloroflexi bacterium]|nr:hypothetical protein [Chloroflexota bacterium]MBI3733893.1 hypothetical protein [Chloroflexota bacterium]
MNRMDPALEQRLKSNPGAQVRLIVLTAKPPEPYTAALQAKGFRVVRVSSLINAVTVEGSAHAALALGDEDWVTRIEEDKPVHTMPRS